MEKKKHLTIEGVQEIVNFKAALNFGLSDKVKIAFPNNIPVTRPLVVGDTQKIKDPH